MLWVFLCAGFQCLCLVYARENNVCRTLKDYATIRTNKNCWHNPDANSSPALIAKRYGYPLEKYKVTTEDGYILTLFRIPRNSTDPNKPAQPVLFQHGIGASAVFWMLQGRKSLAFFLADNGYDVWLTTARGAAYSTQHQSLTINDRQYWNFGFHEMGIYDLPAVTDYITKTIGNKRKIICIGHSMGTTITYIYSMLRKEHAETHLKGLISLSPIAFMKHVQGVYRVLAPFVATAKNLLESLGIYALGHLPIFKDLIVLMCGQYPQIVLCQVVTSATTGLALEQVRADLFPVLLTYFPSGTALKTVLHFAQIILNEGRFQFFDYGPDNLAIYNSTTPPSYDVTTIGLPVHLFIGRQDFLADPQDVDTLYGKLTSPESKTTAYKYYFDFAHNDFFMGRHFTDFYRTLLEALNKIEKT